jgi:hypothetical protein
MMSMQRIVCARGSSGQEPSAQIGAVPPTWIRSPVRTAREYPYTGS